MGLEQTGATSSSLRNLLIIPRNFKSSSVIQFPNLVPSIYSPYKSHSYKWNGSLRCSMNDYKDPSYADKDHSQEPEVSYPKPSTIPWKKELSNSVDLIGYVALPVDIKHLPSGKVVAWTRLSVRKTANQQFWVSLTFWEELAHVAAQYVRKGDQIHVSGRLFTDTIQNNFRKDTYFKVAVQELNFIEKSSEPDPIITDGGGDSGANNTRSAEEVWQAFFANPDEWWDNRKTKKTPRYPDFRHKVTGEALWVENRYNPPWVKSQLEIMDTKMELFPPQDAEVPAIMVSAD